MPTGRKFAIPADTSPCFHRPDVTRRECGGIQLPLMLSHGPDAAIFHIRGRIKLLDERPPLTAIMAIDISQGKRTCVKRAVKHHHPHDLQLLPQASTVFPFFVCPTKYLARSPG